MLTVCLVCVCVSYERDLLRTLENIVKSCDRKIEKQKQRTDQDMLMSEEDAQRVFALHKQISDCLRQCEALGEDKDKDQQGSMDRVYELMKQVSQLQDSANRIASPSDEKRNLVCETSGNFMSSRCVSARLNCCQIVL